MSPVIGRVTPTDWLSTVLPRVASRNTNPCLDANELILEDRAIVLRVGRHRILLDDLTVEQVRVYLADWCAGYDGPG